MPKTKITIAAIGHLPAEFNKQKVRNWSSSVFEIVDNIESYTLPNKSDGYNWEYSEARSSNLNL